MAQTYAQIQKQIEKLQKQADALRQQEVKGVVDRIKVAIAHYGLTAEQLGVSAIASAGNAALAPRKVRAAKKAGTAAAAAKFIDGTGQSWSGRGPRPRWLRDALAAGRSLDEFKAGAGVASRTLPGTATAPDEPAPVASPKGQPGRKKHVGKTAAVVARKTKTPGTGTSRAAVKASTSSAAKTAPAARVFADNAGHSWSGRGPQPAWIKEALADGKALSDFEKKTPV